MLVRLLNFCFIFCQIAVTAAGGWFFSWIRLNNVASKPVPNYLSMRRFRFTKPSNSIRIIQDHQVSRQKHYHHRLNPSMQKEIRSHNCESRIFPPSSHHSCHCGFSSSQAPHHNVPICHCPCVDNALKDPKVQHHIQDVLLSHHHSHQCQCFHPHQLPGDPDHTYM